MKYHVLTILGNGYTSAGTFVSSGSAKALLSVKDADGSKNKLIFEVHKYLDEDNSGTHLNCVSNNIGAFEDLTKFLKDNKRQAILAETGGGPSTKSCLKSVCELLSYLNDNDDVYMGYLGWGAGSFDETYALSLTPEGGDGDEATRKTPMKDVPLMTECFVKLFSGGAGTGGSYSGSSSTNSTTGQSSSSNSTSEESSSGNYDSGSTGESSEQPSSSTPKGSSGESLDQVDGQAGGTTGQQNVNQAGSVKEAKPSQELPVENKESTPSGVQNASGPENPQKGTPPVALKSAQHQRGDTVLDVDNKDETGDDVCEADEVNNTDEEDNKGETEESPESTTNPRPSSTFAISYIPTPSVTGSSGTGTSDTGNSSSSSDQGSGG